jgi:hypothetical protein
MADVFRVPQISVAQMPDGTFTLTPNPTIPLANIGGATATGRNLMAAQDPASARTLLDVPSTGDLAGVVGQPGPTGNPGPAGPAGPAPTVTPVNSVNDIPAGAAVGSLWLPTTV